MGKIVLGKVAFTPKGEFDPNREGGYERYDLVYNDSIMYCSLKDGNTSPTDDAEAWQEMLAIDHSVVEKGAGDKSIQQKIQVENAQAEANGNRSIALGWKSKANGRDCVSIGFGTETDGCGCVAVGMSTKAMSGNEGIAGCSFAEGVNTIATGKSAHSGGIRSVASGFCSFAHGIDVETKNNYEVAFGSRNISNTGTTQGATTLFAIGNGEKGEGDTIIRKNAFEVRQDGSIYIWLKLGDEDPAFVKLQDYLAAVTPDEGEADGEGDNPIIPEEDTGAPDPYDYYNGNGIGNLPMLPDDGVNDEDVETIE